MAAPLVSVVMAAYNHESFVLEAVDSVLSQQGVDLELLVEDDASSDQTAALLETIRDPRVKVVAKQVNEGAYATHNSLLRRATGEFVAVINSDDVWLGRDKLAYQIDILRSDERIGASFGQPAYIGPAGEPLGKDSTFSGRIFEQPNRPQAQWLRHFFQTGNCLCHPTVVIRRECHDRLGPYDNRLRQIADYDMWVRVIKHWNIHNSDRELVAFRVVSGGNTSWPSERNTRRLRNEEYLTAKRLLDQVPMQLMREAFGDVLIAPEITSAAQLEVEKALLYFRSEGGLRPLY
ncbi:MAG: glycosyltransferase, partial [Comamonadaceae bacterium]